MLEAQPGCDHNLQTIVRYTGNTIFLSVTKAQPALGKPVPPQPLYLEIIGEIENKIRKTNTIDKNVITFFDTKLVYHPK